jgi:GNAT superfamily N-acetyltransferase
MNTTRIRTASDSDASAIARLTVQLGYIASEESIRARVQKITTHSEQLLIVAQSGEQVCGWLQAHRAEVIESGARVEILGLVVEEDKRRKGIGRLLVQRAEEWAQQFGVTVMVVRTNVTRIESQPFYAALAYTLTKTQAVYRKSLSS